jgi:hypothetical protein
MTFLGRIQRRDLPGQVVITGPSCELVDAHRHTHPKGVLTAVAVRPTRVASDGALGVSDLEALGFEGVRRMELSPVCVIAGSSILRGVDQSTILGVCAP